MDADTARAIDGIYKKYDRKIDNLDKKYDEKNDKAVEQFTEVRTLINTFSGPVAAMAVQVEANRVSAADAEDSIEKFKSKLFWVLLGAVVSFVGSLIMLGINLAIGA